jgi:hypothetical protein
MKVAAIDSERIILEDGRSMRRDFLRLDQGEPPPESDF